MAKTYTYNVKTPANAEAPTGGAAAMRLKWDAIHERENLDHYWEKSGDTVDADDVGYHRKTTLLVQDPAPSAKANAIILYGKDVDDKCELHAKDEDGDEIQITKAGSLNINLNLGDWVAKASDTVYQAATDGFVTAEASTGGAATLTGFTDGNNPPTTVRIRNEHGSTGAGISGISFPVKKNDYWKVTMVGGAANVYWIPWGE